MCVCVFVCIRCVSNSSLANGADVKFCGCGLEDYLHCLDLILITCTSSATLYVISATDRMKDTPSDTLAHYLHTTATPKGAIRGKVKGAPN